MARRSAKVANHNKEFEEAQNSFLERADKGALERAYKIAYDLAKRYIINYGKNAGVFVAAVEEKAHDVATTIVERKLILRKGARLNGSRAIFIMTVSTLSSRARGQTRS